MKFSGCAHPLISRSVPAVICLMTFWSTMAWGGEFSGRETIDHILLQHRAQVFFAGVAVVVVFLFIGYGVVLNRRLNRAQAALQNHQDHLAQTLAQRTRELDAEKEKLKSIIMAMKDGIYIVDQNYNLEFVNSALTEEFGPYAGGKCHEYFHQQSEHCPMCRNQEVFDGRTVQWEWTSPRTGKVFDLISTPLMKGDGTVSKLEIFRDVTKRKQTEVELEKHRTQLESLVRERTSQLDERIAESKNLNRAMMNVMEDLQASNAGLEVSSRALMASNRDLDAFSYSVSHDLRAPLRHIAGFVNLLRESNAEVLDATGQRHLEFISESTERMGKLIDDLLDFSRTGRVELNMANLDLQLLVGEIVQETKDQTKDRDIDWEVGPLPKVDADRTTMRQVFVNLIDNAVKYSSKRAQARIQVGMIPGREGEQVFFVRDNGVGFDMEYADKLFGVFQRLHPKDDFEGSGVGLAHVRQIVQRHGGQTWAEGKVGGGATFYFSLPLETRKTFGVDPKIRAVPVDRQSATARKAEF